MLNLYGELYPEVALHKMKAHWWCWWWWSACFTFKTTEWLL